MGNEDYDSEIKKLRNRRGVVKGALTRIRTFIREFDFATQAVSLLEFRQEELPLINAKFDSVQSELELISIDMENEEEERREFENFYFEARSQIQEIISAHRAASSTVHNTSFGNTSFVSRAHLPPIDLPFFDGNIQNWKSFFDVFNTMAHKEENGYPPVQKFYHLRSHLTGQALELVQNIPMTENNYNVVLKKLQQRYDNKSLIIQSHIRAILDAPYITEISAESLQKLHSHVGNHVAALEELGQPTKHWDAWLITIVLSRLDKNTSHDWQLRQKDTELPKFKDLDGFLACRCVAFEGSQALLPLTGGVPPKPATRGKNTDSKFNSSLIVSENTIKCYCCTGPHRLFNCEKFKELPIVNRLSFV